MIVIVAVIMGVVMIVVAMLVIMVDVIFVVILNLPLVGIWVRLLSVPYRLLYPAIILFCCIGVFSVNNSAYEVGMLAIFGLLGYVFLKLGCEPAPFLLGFILGPMMDENLRRALLLSHGDFSVFVTRPISATLLVLSVLLLLTTIAPSVRRKREEAFSAQ